MFLLKRPKSSGTYLYLAENYTDQNGKRQKRILKRFGNIDKIPAATLEKLYEQYQKPARERKLDFKIKQEEALKSLDLLTGENRNSNPNFNKLPLLHYGHLLLKPVWDQLGLSYKLSYLQRHDTKISAYSLSDILFYLVSCKVLNPGSYLSAFRAQSSMLCNPIEGVCQDNLYEALDHLFEFKDKIMEHAVRCSYGKVEDKNTPLTDSGPKMVFFDCTNCYFETPFDDKEQFIHKFTEDYKKKLEKRNVCKDKIEEALNSEDFRSKLEAAVNEYQDDFLRMRDPSKEGRFSLPIASISLVIDERGVPIDFTVFPGNQSEYGTVLPTIERLKKKYGIKDCYFVADRGLNSTENLEGILKKDFGFIVAQKVTNQTDKQEEEMLNPKDWKTLNFNPHENNAFLNADLDESFRYKVCTRTKTKRFSEQEQKQLNKPKSIKVNCKIIYIYSEKRRQKDLYELELAIGKANKAIAEGKLMGNPATSGWRGLVKTRKEMADDKADKEQYKAVGLKENVIEKRRKIAGYAAVIYEEPKTLKNAENKLDERAVLGSYHSLEKIEECFRIMKNSFEIRPMYVKRSERTQAHVLICVLALMVVRLMQIKLAEQGNYLTVSRLTEALSSAKVMPLPSKNGTYLLNCTEYKDIFEAKKSRASAEDSETTIKKYLENRATEPDSIDKIMQTFGLTPLSQFNTISQTKLSLKIAQSNKNILGEAISTIQERYAISELNLNNPN